MHAPEVAADDEGEGLGAHHGVSPRVSPHFCRAGVANPWQIFLLLPVPG